MFEVELFRGLRGPQADVKSIVRLVARDRCVVRDGHHLFAAFPDVLRWTSQI